MALFHLKKKKKEKRKKEKKQPQTSLKNVILPSAYILSLKILFKDKVIVLSTCSNPWQSPD